MNKNGDVFFFPNGNAAVTKGDSQAPDLSSKGWAELFAESLEAKGEDPTAFLLHLPNQCQAQFFKTPTGWNLRILEGRG